jgi:beta-aspartyl-peptidase (threonine type)
MRAPARLGAALLLSALAACGAAEPPAWSLAIHGGARNLQPGDYTDEERALLRAELTAALQAGARVLDAGGSSLDAVEAVAMAMEDSPWFNAGRGAVFTHDGRNELDASIMDGATGRAGAVAGVTRIRNPVQLARRVMEHTPHVMLAGAGAEAFAREQGIAFADLAYFRTERRWQELQRELEREKAAAPRARGDREASAAYFGTVGAVARDRAGRLAAATSTGGMTNKRFGRVGDSPIIGAGTFADGACAVSATGHGEYFIRHAVAHEICARARHLRMPVGRAAHAVIHEVLKPAGGEGGVITMDARGIAALEFNTSAMLRGSMQAGTPPMVAIGADEALGAPAGR